MARLIIVANDEICGAGIASVMRRAGHQVIATCACTDELAALRHSHDPDIVILRRDTASEAACGNVASCLTDFTTSPRLVLVLEAAAEAADLLAARPYGIVVARPQAETLLQCIATVAAGSRWVDPDLLPLIARTQSRSSADARLTSREHQVVQHVVRGLRNKLIGREMQLSEGTVKMHLHHIFEKLNVHSRTELALIFSNRSAPGDLAQHKTALRTTGVRPISLDGKTLSIPQVRGLRPTDPVLPKSPMDNVVATAREHGPAWNRRCEGW